MLPWVAKDYFCIDSLTPLEFSALAVVSTWWGLFVLWYGRRAFRLALLPLSLLLFVIPPPESVLNVVIQFLQQGSAVLSCELFRLVGVPALREGTVISLPRLTIIVGPECSGIRSSMSLLILTLAGGNLYLRCGWNKVLLALSVVPLVVLKNAIRIVTLSILAVYVDPDFLTGRLHYRGGILFFLIGLAVVVGIVMVMQWFEKKATAASSTEEVSHTAV
jgi:exosortase